MKPPNLNEELITIETQDHKKVSLWKITNSVSRPDKNIFLTHGTFSNKKVCLGIASYLVKNGFTCWILEWRNHGNSPKVEHQYNFETVGKYDILAAFDFLFNQSKISNVSCVTHSGGGICLTIFLIKNPDYISKIKSISIFGCQTTGAGETWINRLRIYFGQRISYVLGYVPARKTGSPENEGYYYMKQWFDWNLSKRFSGEDDIDYYAHMNKIKIPTLSICGIGDTFIAPPSGCQQFLDAFENSQNKFLLCSKENGYLEDYNHSRILQSRNSSKEIWPQVLKWIEEGNR